MHKFQMGSVYTTAGAAQLLSVDEVATLLERHANGDWGEVPPEDVEENELSLQNGWRVMSVYTVNDQKFWVITEADRRSTTVLLPSEY